MRRAGFGGVVLSLALLAGACGGGDDEGTDDPDTTEATDDTTTGGSGPEGSVTTAPGGAEGGTETTAPGGEGGDGSGGTEGEGGTGGEDGGDDQPAPGELTSDDICRLLPADAAAGALGVDPVTTTPVTSGTPQCSYAFTGADGVDTDATVATLRSAEDMGGRTGTDAYTWVVDLNIEAAAGEVTQTPLSFGDEGVVLTGETLHMAVIRYGDRIVTALLRTNAGDLAAITALAEATTVLAP